MKTAAPRRAALDRVVENFSVGHDKVLEVWGLRLPEHLAYAMGFWEGLSKSERAYASGLFGGAPIGAGAWLAKGRFARAPGDARVPTDAPEMVPVFGTDDERVALWFDDPLELPRVLVHAVSGDSTYAVEPTLLGRFEAMLEEHGNNDPLEWNDQVEAVLTWLGDAHALEVKAYKRQKIKPFQRRPAILGGIGPQIEGWTLPKELGEHSRAKHYEKRSKIVQTWIATARAKLATEPGHALVIGHELIAQDDAAQHKVGVELLDAAYRALGRDALAAIARR